MYRAVGGASGAVLGTGGDQWIRLVSGMGSEVGFEYHACGFHPRLIKELDLGLLFHSLLNVLDRVSSDT